MAAIPPDYDSDPDRRRAFVAPRDVHDVVALELVGPVLDAGCGEGRLARALPDGVVCVGVDASRRQLATNPHQPKILADMRALPFRDDTFASVTHLWCLYHLDDPASAIREARRVLRTGGRYYACSSTRDNDPELVPQGYPRSSFDAEDAAAIVATVFSDIDAEPWDQPFFALETRAEVRAYCRHHRIPAERAEQVGVPLWLTKRGVLVRATKDAGRSGAKAVLEAS